MRQFFSTILSQIRSRKKTVLGGLAIALFFSLVPAQFAQANIFSDIFGLVSNLFIGWSFGIPLAIITAVIYVVAFVAAWLGVALLAILKIFLVASLSFPLLPGHSINVVNVGWEFSRDLVNIVFILILVFIGLATILRIQNYQLQKTLPALILMAVLVNFSGVFVAFIVDIANIFTNAFVSKLGTLSMGVNASETLFKELVNGLAGVVTNITGIGQIILPAVKGAVYLGFYAVFALIMFIVTLLMIVRIGILCALTILAPIAFAARILPATKNFWDQWLKQLIQWAIIGIPITFFLFLAQQAANGAEGIKQKFMAGFASASSELAGVNASLITVFMDLTGPFMALLLVAIGVMVSMQFAPAGANAVINWGKKAGLKAGGWAGREGWRKIGGKVEKWSGGMRTKGEEMNIMAGLQKEQAEKDGKLGFWTRGRLGLKGLSGAALRTAASGVEVGSKRANEVVKKRDEDTIAKAEKEVGENSERGFDIINVESMKKGVLEDTSKMLGAFTKIIKNGDTDDIYDRIKDGRMSWDFVRKMYKNARDNGNVEQRRLIEKAFLSRTQDKKDAQGNIIPNELGVNQKHQDEIWDKLKAQDFDKIVGTENLFSKDEKTGEFVVNQEIADRILEKGEAGIPRQMIQRGKMAERRAFAKYLASKPVAWYQTRDREDIVTLSTTDAAAAVGMLPIGGLTRDEAKRLHREKIKGFRTDEELTTRQRILEDKLQQRNDKLTADLQTPNLPQKERNKIQSAANRELGVLKKEIGELRNERNERSFKDDELYDQKQNWDNELKHVYAMPENQRVGEDYRSIGQAQEQLLRINAELKRRGLALEQKVAVGEQPLSVQIARLKAQEEQLKQTAGTPRTIRGVEIPMTRKGGVSYLPGEKARAERKKIQAKIKKLEERGGKLPIYISALTQNELEQHRQDNGAEIATIDSELTDVIDKRILAQPASPERAELMKREEELKQTRNLVMLEQRQLTEAYLIKTREDLTGAQKTKQLIEQELKTVKERRKGAGQGSKEEQVILADEKRLETQRSQAEVRVGDLTKQENEEYGVWQQFSNFERQQQPELDLAKELAGARTSAKEAQKKVLQLRTAKAAADTIAGAARDLRAKQREQGVLERKLTAQLAMDELQGMIQNTRFYPHPPTPGLTTPPLDDLLVKSFEASIQEIQEKEKLFEVDTTSLPRTEQDRIEREKTAYLKETEERRKRFKEQIEQAVNQEKKI